MQSSLQLAVFPIDAQKDRQRYEVHQYPRPAIAHQRKRQALGRQQAHVDAHVDERLEADPDADTLRSHRCKVALALRRLAADDKRAHHNPDEERDDEQHADEAELLAYDSEEEI